MIAEIQCLPTPPGTDDDRYAHVERAIAVIERSGVRYEVGALGTTIEGEPDVVWPLLRQVHDACVRSGAVSVVTVVKVAEGSASAGTPGMADLVGKFR